MIATASRILYIDDDDGLRRLAEKLLARRGYVVATAVSGPAGVALAAAEPFDLIAVDHYMPGQDGLATLQALRELPDCPPIVYVTGSEESSVAVAAMKAGASDYVVKSTGGDFIDLLDNAFRQALESVRLRTAKTAAEDALRVSNARLETLLHEVNHRVSNSLAMVSAFVHLQAKALTNDEARAALEDTERRIQAIAQVHRRLYTSDDVESVAMDEYLAALVEELQDTWSTSAAPRPIRLDAEQLRLHPDKAVSLGVIVNELVSNACKYAYGDGVAGEVRVRFGHAGDGHFHLIVEDDGIGLTAGAAPRGSGLGSRLVLAMARSLSTNLDYDPVHNGVRASLRAAI
ncbi:MAG: response regulator [Pseudomonadota bacterium]|nr:response regulator [Pseudomonadota bacterium]